mmetsp:Transcript_44889/g.124502  ORF Transcript_44889/g.124502 Transcript_44889/m.124502 type:complete len:138 (-) Transcript_44889:118-531(-)
MSVLVLVLQLFVRMAWLGTCVALMMTTSTWRAGATDSLVFDFCGVLAVNSIGLVISMFLRVYRVMIAALPDRFPTVQQYHEDAGYQALLLVNVMTSLVQYVVTISAAYRMGEGRYFRDSRTHRLTKMPIVGAIRSGR